MKKVKFFSMILSSFIIFSCQNEDISEIKSTFFDNSSLYEKSGKLESNSKERMRNAILEITDLQKEIQSNKNAYQELFLLLHNDYYVDNYVGLSDLLNPESSEIYNKVNVPSNIKGSYKRAFFVEIEKNKNFYPNLSFIANKTTTFQRTNTQDDFDLNFYDLATITFYAPYIEDVNDNEFGVNDIPTYTPGVLDSDEAIGYKKNLVDNTWEERITNDDYALQNFSINIEPNNLNNLMLYSNDFSGGTGSSSGSSNPSNSYTGDCNKLEPRTNDAYIRQVFIGHARINNKKQYDKYISFTGNGGGSEIRIGRLGSREHIEIDSIGNIAADQWDNIVSVYFSRKDIRNTRSKWVGSIWDKNWECRGEIHEQLFGVYEEDTEGNITFDQTIKWKDEDLFSINGTIQNRSQDQIIRKWTREKTEFFVTNLLDQGGGSWTGENSFSDRDWAIYDVGTDFCYTMPHRWVYVLDNTSY